MRFWLKFLVGFLALIFVVLAGAALFVAQIDPNDYRNRVSSVVKNATGRALRIGGDLRIKLLPNPSLEANDVAFANAEWASQPDMVRVERLQAEIMLAPLLRGTVVVQNFVAIAPQVYLETDADGRGNWELGDATQPRSQRPADSRSRLMDVVLNRIHVENAALDYTKAESAARTEVRVEVLELGANRQDGPLALELRARFQDLPVVAKGSVGAAATVLRNERFAIDIEGSAGEARFSVEGAIGKPLDGEQLDLRFASTVPSTRAITDAIGVDAEELGPIDASLEVSGSTRRLNLNPFSISARPLGTESRLEGSVTDLAPRSVSLSADDEPGEPMRLDVNARFGDARAHLKGGIGNLVAARDVRLAVHAQTPSTRQLSDLAGFELEELGPLDVSLTLVGENGRFDLDDITLDARPRDTAAKVTGWIKDVALGRGEEDAQPARVDLRGTFGEARFDASGEVGKPLEGKDVRLKVSIAADSTRTFSELAGIDVEELGPLDAAATVIEKDGRFDLTRIDVKARPRDANLAVKGSIANVTGKPRPDLQVALSAKSLRHLDHDLPASGPVEVSARIEPRGEVIEVHDLVTRIGKSDLSGSITLRTGGQRPSADAKLRSRVIDVNDLVPAGEAASTAQRPVAEQPLVEKASSTPKRLFPDKALPFDVLKRADADIDLAVDRLFTRTVTLAKVNLSARLKDGNLTFKPAAHVSDGSFDATIGIDARTQPTTLNVTVEAKSISIGKLGEEIRGYQTSQGLASDLKAKLTSRGESVRAIMGELDGDFAIEIGEGRLKNDTLHRVGADIFTQIFGVLVPSDEDDGMTKVNCGVMRFTVNDGEAVADKTLVMQTDKVLMSGSGLVDLKTEEVDAGAVLTARQGIKIGVGTLSNLVRLRGTLAEPRLGTDLTGMTKTGVKIGAAVFTAGLSLLAEGILREVAGDPNPCRTAMERTINTSPSELERLLSLE